MPLSAWMELVPHSGSWNFKHLCQSQWEQLTDPPLGSM
jgi:hypothetical protein